MDSKRTFMTLANRVKVLKLSAAGRSSSWIAKHIGVGKTQIQNMIKIEILDEFEKNGNINANGPRRAARSDDVNELVSQWFNDANGRLSHSGSRRLYRLSHIWGWRTLRLQTAALTKKGSLANIAPSLRQTLFSKLLPCKWVCRKLLPFKWGLPQGYRKLWGRSN